MKHARGKVRELLLVIGEMQNLIGRARGANMDDRNPSHYQNVEKPLREAFDLAIGTTGEYYPLDMLEKERANHAT